MPLAWLRNQPIYRFFILCLVKRKRKGTDANYNIKILKKTTAYHLNILPSSCQLMLQGIGVIVVYIKMKRKNWKHWFSKSSMNKTVFILEALHSHVLYIYIWKAGISFSFQGLILSYNLRHRNLSWIILDPSLNHLSNSVLNFSFWIFICRKWFITH